MHKSTKTNSNLYLRSRLFFVIKYKIRNTRRINEIKYVRYKVNNKIFIKSIIYFLQMIKNIF